MFRRNVKSTNLLAAANRQLAKADRARARADAAVATAANQRALAEQVLARERVDELSRDASLANDARNKAIAGLVAAKAERSRARALLKAAEDGVINAEAHANLCTTSLIDATAALETAKKTLPKE